jgi:uncharacterized protein YndB with AHSA1/START domain
MPQIRESITIEADPDRVWAVAGDPATISEWLPAIATSSLQGDERSCTTVDGAALKERVLERNDAEHYYVYEITDAPMPVASYRSRLSVDGHDGHSHVGWTADFEAADDAAAPELEQTFTQIYREGLESLRARVEGSS